MILRKLQGNANMVMIKFPLYAVCLSLIALLFSPSAFAEAPSEASLISAWEQLQTSSKHVEHFEKLADKHYKIKFSRLPYEGKLTIIGVDVDEMPTAVSGIDYAGYVEVDLPDENADLGEKYARSYYKWAQNNDLYFDNTKQQWITANDFAKIARDKSPSGSWIVSLFNYWNYLLVFIILYFFISQIINNRRVKQSLAIQQQAVEKSTRLHQETNNILKEILKQQNNQK